MDKLLKYLNSLSKADRSQFVDRCETSEGYLRKAISSGQKLGGDLCINIDRESNGAVACEDLRPDADWAYLRHSQKASPKQNRSTPTEQLERETDPKTRAVLPASKVPG